MKKWKFREDMLLHYINGCSERTFQDAEDRLNYLEDNLGKIIEQAFKKGIEWKANGKNVFMEDAIKNAQQEILKT